MAATRYQIFRYGSFSYVSSWTFSPNLVSQIHCMYKDYLEMLYRVESFVLKDSNTFGLILNLLRFAVLDKIIFFLRPVLLLCYWRCRIICFQIHLFPWIMFLLQVHITQLLVMIPYYLHMTLYQPCLILSMSILLCCY